MLATDKISWIFEKIMFCCNIHEWMDTWLMRWSHVDRSPTTHHPSLICDDWWLFFSGDRDSLFVLISTKILNFQFDKLKVQHKISLISCWSTNKIFLSSNHRITPNHGKICFKSGLLLCLCIVRHKWKPFINCCKGKMTKCCLFSFHELLHYFVIAYRLQKIGYFWSFLLLSVTGIWYTPIDNLGWQSCMLRCRGYCQSQPWHIMIKAGKGLLALDGTL